MIKIRGASDDLVEIYGSCYREDEIGCWEKDVRIRFLDGTIIRVGYPKGGKAIWWIEVENKAQQNRCLPSVMMKMTMFTVIFLRLIRKSKVIQLSNRNILIDIERRHSHEHDTGNSRRMV